MVPSFQFPQNLQTKDLKERMLAGGKSSVLLEIPSNRAEVVRRVKPPHFQSRTRQGGIGVGDRWRVDETLPTGCISIAFPVPIRRRYWRCVI